MKTRMFSLSLILALFACSGGCVSKYQYEIDRSLLVQENQKLEDALYVTHSQLADAMQENEQLRSRLGEDGLAPDVAPSKAGARENGRSSYPPLRRPAKPDVAPTMDEDYTPPEVHIPEESEGTTQPPELFQKTPSSIKTPATRTVSNPSPPSFPEWNPRR